MAYDHEQQQQQKAEMHHQAVEVFKRNAIKCPKVEWTPPVPFAPKTKEAAK
ncbi:hypothetical protein [Paraburkholderia heleia]|uniref:hypothetical protein n=1 Tax=Paraburkholderia heleia TaxID=634127 RepID=UPI000B1A0F0A|nr:hypothetical protein [Paraburkholderia heleia]